MTSHFPNMMPSSNFFWRCFVFLVEFSYLSKFHVNMIMVQELWQFVFIRDWPKIQKLEISPSEFCPISGDWGEKRIPNLSRTSLIRSYWMLQNARGCSFYRFWVIKGKPTGGGEGRVKLPLPPPRLGLKLLLFHFILVILL